MQALDLNEDDMDFLAVDVIGLKLSQEAIDFVSRGHTTSRNESVNRAISKGDPKNCTRSRTGAARNYSAIGRQNNSVEKFLLRKFEAMKCPLPEDSAGAKLLRKYQHGRDLRRAYQESPVAK